LRERPQGQRVRRSSELPDHVGRVFVTAVPNVPIQVMGRRDPATGELCVGSIGTPQKDAPWPPVDLPSWIEVVTGPEAERLILAVHRSLIEQAEQKGGTLEEFIGARKRDLD